MKSVILLPSQLVGEWIGNYHGHFEEVVRIDLINGKWVATKITGDENVPAGEITWRVDPSTYMGEGQIAGQGFLQPCFIPGHLEILSPERIVFHWDELGNVEYRRDD
jgi:hypothetical protein